MNYHRQSTGDGLFLWLSDGPVVEFSSRDQRFNGWQFFSPNSSCATDCANVEPSDEEILEAPNAPSGTENQKTRHHSLIFSVLIRGFRG